MPPSPQTSLQTALLSGAMLIVASECLLTIMGAVIKHLSAELPTEMIVFFRNLFGVMLLAPYMLRHGPGRLRTRVPHLHLLRGLTGVGAMYCFFTTLAQVPLAEALLMKLTAPFFLPIIAWLWLGEHVPARTRWSILVGFIGVAVVLRPGFAAFSPYLLLGLLGAALAALAKVAIRRMGETESGPQIVFFFGLIATSVSAVPLTWAWQTPSYAATAWLLGMGVLATIAQLAFTHAYRLAPPASIGPFTYSSVVFGALIGWWVWRETLLPTTWAGSVLIVVAGVLALGMRNRGQSAP